MHELLEDGGDALSVFVYDVPYYYIFNEVSKIDKWGKYKVYVIASQSNDNCLHT